MKKLYVVTSLDLQTLEVIPTVFFDYGVAKLGYYKIKNKYGLEDGTYEEGENGKNWYLWADGIVKIQLEEQEIVADGLSAIDATYG